MLTYIDLVTYALSTFTAHPISLPPSSKDPDRYELGAQYKRENMTARTMHVTANGQNVEPCQPNLEGAVWPFLFPYGRGFHNNVMTLLEYGKLRTRVLFSLFTLCKTYVLIMYQLRQASMLLSLKECSAAVLEQDLARIRCTNP